MLLDDISVERLRTLTTSGSHIPTGSVFASCHELSLRSPPQEGGLYLARPPRAIQMKAPTGLITNSFTQDNKPPQRSQLLCLGDRLPKASPYFRSGSEFENRGFTVQVQSVRFRPTFSYQAIFCAGFPEFPCIGIRRSLHKYWPW